MYSFAWDVVIKERRVMHIDVYGEIHRYPKRGEPVVESGCFKDTKGISVEGWGTGEFLIVKTSLDSI